MLSPRVSVQPSRPATRTASPAASLWALRCLEPSCAGEIEQLLDRMSELSMADWLAIGARMDVPARDLLAARRRLQILLSERELAVNAWYVRDLATTCTWRCQRPPVRASRRDRRQLIVARDAAVWAAVALVARTRLSSGDFEVLYAAVSALVGRD